MRDAILIINLPVRLPEKLPPLNTQNDYPDHLTKLGNSLAMIARTKPASTSAPIYCKRDPFETNRIDSMFMPNRLATFSSVPSTETNIPALRIAWHDLDYVPPPMVSKTKSMLLSALPKSSLL
jgi:hypothetical protein